MKIKVYTVIEGTSSYGDICHVFGSEEAQDNWFAAWIDENFNDWLPDEKQPEDPWDAWERMRDQGYCETMEFDFTYVSIPMPPQARELKAALGQLLEQVYQMQGLFDDEDNTIQNAINDAEEALENAN